MTTIRNKTKRPLKVPLPGGKLLRLAPGKDGEVNVKAANHPGLQAMVAAGDIEIVQEGKGRGGFGDSGPGLSGTPGRDIDRTIRKTGDG